MCFPSVFLRTTGSATRSDRTRLKCATSRCGPIARSASCSITWTRRSVADNYVAVFTADHGVAPMPEVMQQRRMPGGRIPEGTVLNAVQARFIGEVWKWRVGGREVRACAVPRLQIDS